VGGKDLVLLLIQIIIIFKGTFQELRYWGKPLNEDAFDFHVLNPESYEGNTTGSSYQHLALRLPLGNDLHISSSAGDYITSTHPGSTPNYITSLTSSFNDPSFSVHILEVRYHNHLNHLLNNITIIHLTQVY
jgi:hypothetical protein